MILKFKKFESKKWNDKEGGYVVLKSGRNVKDKYTDFIENNVAKVVKMYYPGSWFRVEFENTPDYVKKILNNKGEFNSAEVLFYSKNKEECQEFIDIKNSTKRFNL